MADLPSFYRLNNIPLDGLTRFCLSVHPLLPSMNDAVLNMGIQMSESLLSVLLHIHPE